MNKINLEKIKNSKSTQELSEFSIINIDKPSGPTSFSVDEFVKKKLSLRKTSHFGTLDPKVTGVLPLALNRACKLTGFFLGEDKEYVGIMRFHEAVERKRVEEIISEKFKGIIKQTPPVKSRVKRQEREREIKSFEILEMDENGKDFLFRTSVQGGTYIRKLVDDLGKEMNVGAHMLELRRTRAGIFDELGSGEIKYPSVNLYELEKAVDEYKNGNGDDTELRKILIPGEIVCELFPVVFVKKEIVKKLYTGKPIFKEDVETKEKEYSKEGNYCVFYEYKEDKKFVGVYKRVYEKGIVMRPEFVMSPVG